MENVERAKAPLPTNQGLLRQADESIIQSFPPARAGGFGLLYAMPDAYNIICSYLSRDDRRSLKATWSTLAN